MDIEELSVFGLYSQKENKVTAALLQLIHSGGVNLLRWILSDLGNNLEPDGIECIISQAAQEGSGSVPDGKIVCDSFTLLIESKLECGITSSQLKNHMKLLNNENTYLIYITNNPTRPEELPAEVMWTNWDRLLCSIGKYPTSDAVLSFLIEQFRKLINSLFKDVRYYKEKGELRVSDNVKVHSMTDAYNIFDAKPIYHGFLVGGAADVPNCDGYEVWCSRKGSTVWNNQLTADGAVYYEGAKKDKDSIGHVNKCIEKGFKRIAFYRDEDRYHDKVYHFIGVYELDKDKSLEQKRCVWKRKSMEWNLKDKIIK